MNLENMTIILPGEPQDVALEIGKEVAFWFHENHGKEITYKLISKKKLATKMPKSAQRAMQHVTDDEYLLALDVIPDEDWDSHQARDFMEMVNQMAWQIFVEMCDDEGEEWKAN